MSPLKMPAYIHTLTTLAVWSQDPDTTRFSPRVWLQSTEYTCKARPFYSPEVMKRSFNVPFLEVKSVNWPLARALSAPAEDLAGWPCPRSAKIHHLLPSPARAHCSRSTSHRRGHRSSQNCPWDKKTLTTDRVIDSTVRWHGFTVASKMYESQRIQMCREMIIFIS